MNVEELIKELEDLGTVSVYIAPFKNSESLYIDDIQQQGNNAILNLKEGDDGGPDTSRGFVRKLKRINGASMVKLKYKNKLYDVAVVTEDIINGEKSALIGYYS